MALLSERFHAGRAKRSIVQQIKLSDLNLWGESISWQEFSGRAGVVDGRLCKIIQPKNPLAGRPWIWKPEFLDAFPEVDRAMVREGFHLVSMDVTDHYGCPKAIKHGLEFYAFVTREFGFNRKVAFLALSRGALFAYNWTVANPRKVACIYADNPVCDIKSWPGGQGAGPGSPEDWVKCLKRYEMTEEEVCRFSGNPIDHLEVLAGAGIPVLHVAADADELVPISENTHLLRQRYLALGGAYSEIIKHGEKHHPHGLADVYPIVCFLNTHTIGVASA